MMTISRNPELGPHGWQAVIRINGAERVVRHVGTRAGMQIAAQNAERQMAATPRRSPDPEAARLRQIAVRRQMQDALPC